jgi:hypothetical protein
MKSATTHPHVDRHTGLDARHAQRLLGPDPRRQADPSSADVACPAPPCSTGKLTAEANHYWPIGKGFVLYLDGQVGYGKTYGSNGISDSDYTTLQDAVTDHTLVDMRRSSRSLRTSIPAVCATCAASRTTPGTTRLYRCQRQAGEQWLLP